MKKKLQNLSLKNKGNVAQWLKAIILVLGFAALMLLVWTTVVNREFIVCDSEKSIVRPNSIVFILGTVGGLILLLGGGVLLRRVNPKIVFRIMAIAFLIAGVFMTFNMPTLIRADQSFTYQIANQMQHGDFSALLQSAYLKGDWPFQRGTGGYVAIYPFQLGYISYMRLLECFSMNIRFFYFLNTLFVILINYLLYRIVKLLMDEHVVAQNYTILLSFTFLPQLFFIVFVYGNIPGLCACLGAVYFGLRFMQDTKKYRFSSIGCVLLFVLAYQLKSNYQIAVIALGIVFILHAIKHRKYALILMPIVTFAFMISSNKIITVAYENESGHQIHDGMPMINYVAMGLEKENHDLRCPGWYDGISVDLYVNNGFNEAKTSKAAKKKIAKEIKYFKTHPHQANKFFTNKFISTWADPTFQSVWSAPKDEKPKTEILKNIYYENYAQSSWYKKSMKKIAAWCNFLVIAILVLSASLIITKRLRLNSYVIFALLYLMGGMIFHLFWETKSQYVFQYIVCLIPLAAMMLDKVVNDVSELSKIGKH